MYRQSGTKSWTAEDYSLIDVMQPLTVSIQRRRLQTIRLRMYLFTVYRHLSTYLGIIHGTYHINQVNMYTYTSTYVLSERCVKAVECMYFRTVRKKFRE